MIYEQFIVSIVELIMLSWQPILLYNFHNMRVTWLFYHFSKLQVHFLHSLQNISIFNIWKLWLVSCDVIFSGTSLILPKMSENFWIKEIPLWWFPDSTLKLNNSRMAWLIPAIFISFSSILNALSYEINLFLRCSSPLRSLLLAGPAELCHRYISQEKFHKKDMIHRITFRESTSIHKPKSEWESSITNRLRVKTEKNLTGDPACI